jgi:hypothetical protein
MLTSKEIYEKPWKSISMDILVNLLKSTENPRYPRLPGKLLEIQRIPWKPGQPVKSMETHGSQCVFIGIHRYPQKSLETRANPYKSMEIHGRKFLAIHGYQWKLS